MLREAVTEDATLGDFLDGDDGADDEASIDPTGDELDADESVETAADIDPVEGDDSIEGEADDPVDPETDSPEIDGVEPAISTFAWGEYECPECGSSVDRVWREDGELVCESCKRW